MRCACFSSGKACFPFCLQHISKEAGSSAKPGRCTTNVTMTSHICKKVAERGLLNCCLRLPPLPRPTAAAPPHMDQARLRDWTASAPRRWIGWKGRSASVTACSTCASPWCRLTCWRSSTCWVSPETDIRACRRSRMPAKVKTWRPH